MFNILILDIEKASNSLFITPGQEDYNYPQGPITLRNFGSNWVEAILTLEETKDPYIDQSKSTEILLCYGYETEILQEVLFLIYTTFKLCSNIN